MIKIVFLLLALFVGFVSGLLFKEKVEALYKWNIRPTIREVSIVWQYDPILCPSKYIGIAYFGQSNAANSVKPSYSGDIPGNLYQYDWITGKCYKYREPLLGATGSYGNSITPAAVKIAENFDTPVLIIPFARGGLSIIDWAYGYLSVKLDYVLAQLAANNITPNIFLFHNGESDRRRSPDIEFSELPHFQASDPAKFAIGTSEADYEKALHQIVSETLQYFSEAYFGISLVSRCKSEEDEGIRSAQIIVAKKFPKAFLSADSDKIWGKSYRYDECHFSDRGAETLSSEYVQSITKILRK